MRSVSRARSSAVHLSQRGWRRSVRVRLGAMALTLMPKGPSSSAIFFVKAMMPPLAAA